MPWSTLCVDQSQCLLPTPMALAHKLTFASTSLPLPAPLSYCVPQVCLPHRSTLPKWQWVQLNCANGRKQGKKDALLPCPSHPVFFPLYNHLTEFCERNEQGVYHTLWWGAGPSENLLWSLFPEHTSSSVSALVSDGYHWDRNPKPLLIQKVESAHLSFTSLRFCKQLLTHNPAALSQHYMYFLINESKKKKGAQSESQVSDPVSCFWGGYSWTSLFTSLQYPSKVQRLSSRTSRFSLGPRSFPKKYIWWDLFAQVKEILFFFLIQEG